MIKELSVKNFAIIEDLKLEFNEGMTVLTGETGAGKSLIIDTISLLLGSRADSDMVRYGKNEAIVEGVFSTNDNLNEILNNYNIKKQDNIIIYREISITGKNIIKINNKSESLQTLKNIALYLADLHIQNDTNKLFNQENYLDILDPKNDNKFDKLKANYSKALFKYNNIYDKLNHIKNHQKEALERLEFLEYEKKELEELNLYKDIDKDLENDALRLENFDKIQSNLIASYNALNGEINASDLIYEASKALENISSYDNKYADMAVKLKDSYYIISEIKDDISNDINNLDYNEEELDLINSRLNDINHAKDKYKKSVDELISYLDKIKLDIEITTNFDETLKSCEEELKSSFEDLKSSAITLHEYRLKIAKKLEDKIIKECIDLDLENTNFEIKFDDVDFSNYLNKQIFLPNGIDKIDFLISFNKGEPKRSLYKVASGGEASRLMLAFKSYLNENSQVGLMVFDEIDTGVSGQTAKKIALKIKEISKNVQVLCITHNPQVAAIGDYHKHIYKEYINDRTYTKIDDLNKERRIEEIALMLSGDKLSTYALEHAKSLLEE